MVGAFLLGLPLLRLRGHYLGMATFALALGTASLANAATWLTGGPIGIAGVPPLRAFGQDLSANPKLFYALTWIICGVALLTTVLLMRSYIGRAWRALATRQDIAASLGINVSRYRLLVLAIAAVMASVAGSLYAEYTAFTAPDFYDIGLVINLYFMLYIGGRGSILGPVLGAAFVVIVPEEISSLQSQANLVFFVALLLLILLRPGGILGSSRGNGSLSDTLPRPVQRRLAALRRPSTQPGAVS
jgi:branched-chain amino acid transport system permease protein